MTLGGVTGTALKALTALKSDLVGDGVHMTGYLGTLKVKDVLNGADIILDGAAPALPRNAATRITAGRILGTAADPTDIRTAVPLASLTAVSVGEGTITAPSVGVINARGKPGTRLA